MVNCSRCGASISRHHISGFCRDCRVLNWRKKHRDKLKEKKICWDCLGHVNPVIIYPNGLDGIKIVQYLGRCYKCNQSHIKYKSNRKVLKVNK